MQKSRGRPKSPVETEQVAVRLPKTWVEHFQPHVSKQIRERLARSFADEARDPQMLKIAGQIEELAKAVRRATGGFDWHSDQTAHAIFLETLRLLFADLPAPKAKQMKGKMDPAAAAALIYNGYAMTVRELEQNRKTGMRVPVDFLLKQHFGEGSDD